MGTHDTAETAEVGMEMTPLTLSVAIAILSAGIAWGVSKAEGRRNSIEIEAIKRLITGIDGRSAFILRPECENNYRELCAKADRASAETQRMFVALEQRLREMDNKRDRAREQDQKAFELVRTDIRLIQQHIKIMHGNGDEAK